LRPVYALYTGVHTQTHSSFDKSQILKGPPEAPNWHSACHKKEQFRLKGWDYIQNVGEIQMKDALLRLSVKLQSMAGNIKDNLQNEEGQDLIEYALVVGLIAFAAAATMQTLANGINTAFGGISNKLTTYLP